LCAVTSSTSKRVLLYRFDREPFPAIVNPSTYLLENGLELLTAAGTVQNLRYEEVKALCFVSEGITTADLFKDNIFFERRPKIPGLWTRFNFRDGSRLDGILPHNLLEWPASGYLITPPKAGPARQRVLIPRVALWATELRGVVGKSDASLRLPADSKRSPSGQLNMFDR